MKVTQKMLPGSLQIACTLAGEGSQVADPIGRAPAAFGVGRTAGLRSVVCANLQRVLKISFFHS
jgi:hypothetical protein